MQCLREAPQEAFLLYLAVRRVSEAVKTSSDKNVPALRASIPFSVRYQALTRAAIHCRRFAPLSFAPSPNHNASSHFETSLEEAAVRRPGRKAGIENGQTIRRRRGTGIMPAVILAQLP